MNKPLWITYTSRKVGVIIVCLLALSLAIFSVVGHAQLSERQLKTISANQDDALTTPHTLNASHQVSNDQVVNNQPVNSPNRIDANDEFERAQCFVDAEVAYSFLQNQQKLQQLSEAHTNKVNINKATEAELISLKGIGSKKAQEIIRYRETLGAFISVDDLSKVNGIGSKTVANNRARLLVR